LFAQDPPGMSSGRITARVAWFSIKGYSMSLEEIIGFVAGFGTTFAAVPDLIKMFKRQSSQGMNPTMASIMGTFQIVWVYYGFLIDSRPVIAWNLVAVGINFLTVGAYFYFASHEKKRD
jgi:MtN3 and saliva related transmembrane protein